MNKSVFLILFIVIINYTTGFSYDINKIRIDYIASVKSEKTTSKLYAQLKNIENPNPLILAYLGSVDALRAKHSWNPINKLGFLKSGCKTLDEAVVLSPNQIEIRFLRFSLEHYLPDFLGYSQHLEQDRKKLIELVKQKDVVSKQIDQTILKNIIKFLIESKRCTVEEIKVLKKIEV